MSLKLFAPALAALALLGACATATPYQAAAGSNSGYADQQIESNRWSVSFAGNSQTDRKTVETYLLYRAAELTVQQGFDHFKVVRRDTDADSRVIASGFYDPFYHGFYPSYRFYGPHANLHYSRYRSFSRRGFYDPFWGQPSDFREVVRYEATAEIIMGQGEKPEDAAEYFSAEDVLVNLSGTIVLPETL